MIDADVFALGERRAGDDRQQARFLRIDSAAAAARLAEEADDAAFEAGCEGGGHIDALDAVAAGLQLEQVGANHLLALAPVAADRERAAIIFEDRLGLVGERAEDGRIGTAEAGLDAAAGAGAEEEFFGDRVGVGILLVEMLLDRRHQAVDLVGVVDVDEELDERAILHLRRVDEQEPQAAAADERRDVFHAGLRLDELADRVGEGLGLADVGSGGQEGVDHELRPRRGREEALLDFAEAPERGEEGDDRQGNHQAAEPQRLDEQVAIPAEQRAAIRIVGGRPVCDRIEEQVAQQRRHRDRRDPAEAQRNEDHPEQRVAVFAGAIFGEADRGEGDDADRGRAEQRPLILGDDFADDFELVAAGLDADLDAFDDDDRVVGEHAERDDQRAEGDPLHEEIALEVHHEEGRHDREEEHDADDETGLAPHRDEQHDEHDRDRLGQVEDEVGGGGGDGFGLEVDLADLDADRLMRLELGELAADAFAHRDDVAAGDGRDAEADGGLAVVAEQAAGRVLVVADERGHVAKRELSARGVGADDHVEHVVGRAGTRRADRSPGAPSPTRMRPPSAATFLACSLA